MEQYEEKAASCPGVCAGIIVECWLLQRADT